MSEARPGTLVLLVHESWWAMAWDRALTFGFVVGVIGVGVALDSRAMQWVGFLCVLLAALAKVGQKWSSRVTPQQAADRLLAEFGVAARAENIVPLPRDPIGKPGIDSLMVAEEADRAARAEEMRAVRGRIGELQARRPPLS